MPFFRFHAVDADKLQNNSDYLINAIAEVLNCPIEHIVVEVVNSTFLTEANGVQAYPFVKVEYFERPKNQQDQVAKIIYEFLKKAGYNECDIYFTYLQKEYYYENGLACFK